MTLDEITSLLERYGFVSKKEYNADLAWGLKQTLKNISTEDQTIREELCLRFTWKYSGRRQIHPQKNLMIYEDESVSCNGVTYDSPGRMYYYFSFGLESSRVYQDDELDLLMKDIHTQLLERMGVDEIRDIKLVDLGIHG